jgi:hypothetical protein
MKKPRIIVLSGSTDTTFSWLSDGWYDVKKRGEYAKALMAKARQAIASGSDVPDTISKLEAVGFEVTQDPDFSLLYRRLVEQPECYFRHYNV